MGWFYDLVIEQTLMRSIKGRGGLTRGRGVGDSKRTVWLKTMTECARVKSFLTTLACLDKVETEHVDVSRARTVRDAADLLNTLTFFEINSPLKFLDSTRLVSLTSGVVTGPDDTVN